MNCINCKNFNMDNWYCVISLCKPFPTGNPNTCPYYKTEIEMIWKEDKADYVIYDQYGWQLPGHIEIPINGTKDDVLEMYRFQCECNQGHSLGILPKEEFEKRFKDFRNAEK